MIFELTPGLLALGAVAYALAIVAFCMVFLTKWGSNWPTLGMAIMLVALALGGIFGLSIIL